MSSEMSSSCTEIEEMVFPVEIFMEIWSHLDFDTLQKTCTRVSKSWLGMIRSSKLSWKMKLRDTRLGLLGVTDFNAILSQWQDLRELHFSSEQDFTKFRFSLNPSKSLEKIVIPSMIEFRTEWTSNDVPHSNDLTVTRYWIDPKHLMTPTDEIKNVIELNIRGREIPEEFAMRQNDCDFTCLEKLGLFFGEYNPVVISSVNFVSMLSRFKGLKNLKTGIIVIHIDYIHIDYLLDILRFLGDMKTLKISALFYVMSDLDEEATKDIFIKALEIVREKFPYPDARILKLEILGLIPITPIHNHIYNIFYGESGAILQDYTSDSEQDNTSDSEDDTTSDSEDEN